MRSLGRLVSELEDHRAASGVCGTAGAPLRLAFLSLAWGFFGSSTTVGTLTKSGSSSSMAIGGCSASAGAGPISASLLSVADCTSSSLVSGELFASVSKLSEELLTSASLLFLERFAFFFFFLRFFLSEGACSSSVSSLQRHRGRGQPEWVMVLGPYPATPSQDPWLQCSLPTHSSWVALLRELS